MSTHIYRKSSEILIEARKLIENPNNWIREQYAMTADGVIVDPTHYEASCFCSAGALRKVCDTAIGDSYDSHKNLERYRAYQYLSMYTSGLDVPKFNDTRLHREVLEMWDSAIKMALANGD